MPLQHLQAPPGAGQAASRADAHAAEKPLPALPKDCGVPRVISARALMIVTPCAHPRVGAWL